MLSVSSSTYTRPLRAYKEQSPQKLLTTRAWQSCEERPEPARHARRGVDAVRLVAQQPRQAKVRCHGIAEDLSGRVLIFDKYTWFFVAVCRRKTVGEQAARERDKGADAGLPCPATPAAAVLGQQRARRGWSGCACVRTAGVPVVAAAVVRRRDEPQRHS